MVEVKKREESRIFRLLQAGRRAVRLGEACLGDSGLDCGPTLAETDQRTALTMRCPQWRRWKAYLAVRPLRLSVIRIHHAAEERNGRGNAVEAAGSAAGCDVPLRDAS